jgi:hypothetical protein
MVVLLRQGRFRVPLPGSGSDFEQEIRRPGAIPLKKILLFS